MMIEQHPIRIARYYPEQKRLTYFIADKIQVTRTELSESQARGLILMAADGPREMVQRLDIVPIARL